MLTSIAGDTPVIADMDTGFGSVLNISRTVQMYERAGAAAFHIEDQVMYDYFWFFFRSRTHRETYHGTFVNMALTLL